MPPALLASPGPLFVTGRKTNQDSFCPRFDHIVLLGTPDSVPLARIDTPYGKTPAERAEILANLAAVEPLPHATCTLEIDTTAPLDDVARKLEALINWSRSR